MIKLNTMFSIILLGVLATGCTDKDKNTDNNDKKEVIDTTNYISSLSGTIDNGLTINNIVCLDINNNNKCDNSEIHSVADQNGDFTLNINADINKNTQLISFNGLDSNTGLNNNTFLSSYIYDIKKTNINYYTTLVNSIMDEKSISSFNSSSDLLSNIIGTTNDKIKETPHNTKYLIIKELMSLLNKYTTDNESYLSLLKTNIKSFNWDLNSFKNNIINVSSLNENDKIVLKELFSDLLINSTHSVENNKIIFSYLLNTIETELKFNIDLNLISLKKDLEKLDVYVTNKNTFKFLSYIGVIKSLDMINYFLNQSSSLFNYNLSSISTMEDFKNEVINDDSLNDNIKQLILSKIALTRNNSSSYNSFVQTNIIYNLDNIEIK